MILARDYLNRNVCVYRNSSDTKGVDRTVRSVLEDMRDGKLTGLVAEVRRLHQAIPALPDGLLPDDRKGIAAWKKGDPEAHGIWDQATKNYNGAKRKLPASTTSGPFRPGHRHGETPPLSHLEKFPDCRTTGLLEHSGLVIEDLDHLAAHGADPELLMEQFAAHPAVIGAHLSPSGDGIKVLMAVDPVPWDDKSHVRAWAGGRDALASIHTDIDESGKNLSRISFQSDDPGCYIAPDDKMIIPARMAEPAPEPEEPPRAKPRGRPRREPTLDEVRGALDYLAAQGAGADDDSLVGAGTCLKSLGHAFEEFDEWAAAAGCSCTNRRTRWDTFKNSDTDYSAIIGLAVNQGWKGVGKLRAAAKAQGWTSPGGTGHPGVSVSVSPEFLEELAEDHKKKRNLWTSPDPRAGAYRYCRQFADDTLVVLPQEARTAAMMGRRRFVRVLLLDRSTGLWREADAEIDRRHSDIMDQATDHAYLLAKKELISFNELLGIVKRLNGARTPAAADAMIQTLPGVALAMPEDCRPKICRINELDAHRGYLSAENGLVDLRKGSLVPVEEVPGLLFQARPGTPRFVPDARHPLVDHLLSHLGQEKEEFIWNWCGRASYGLPRPENGMLAQCGTRPDGGEGKTTFINALQVGLGGGNMGRVSADAVSSRGKGKHGPTPEREVLTDKLIAYSEETGGWDICEETMKDFTGGAPIAFQPKYGPEVTMPVRASLLISGNSLPIFGEDPAMRRRMRVVTFTRPPNPDSAYANAVDTKSPDPAVAEAVLARICRAAREHPPELDPLPIPEVISRETDDFVDSIREDFSIWVQNVVVRDQDGFLSTDHLWDAWVRHIRAPAAAERVGGITKRKALQLFRNTWKTTAAVVVTRNGENTRGWNGYTLRPETLLDELYPAVTKLRSYEPSHSWETNIYERSIRKVLGK